MDNANPHSSDAGIHAASYGGLWQCVVYGFGGLRMLGGKLRISPALPEAWNALRYTLMWKGQRIEVEVTKDEVKLTAPAEAGSVELEIWGKDYSFTGSLCVKR